MASFNKVYIMGAVGKDPKLKYSQAGVAMVALDVATNEYFTDRNGNKTQNTEWHRVVAFAKNAENCANYLHKGSTVFVEGSLATRKWTNQQGQDQYTTEIKAQKILFLDRKAGNKEDRMYQGNTEEQDNIPNLLDRAPF